MFAHESPAVWLGHGYLQLVAATNTRLADAVAEGTADGEVLAQVVQPDETRQAITFLIVCLVGIAFLLAALTVWYWQFTSPKRRAKSLLSDLGHYESNEAGASSAEVPVPTDVLVPAVAASSLIIESKSSKQPVATGVGKTVEPSVVPPAAPLVAPPMMPAVAKRPPQSSRSDRNRAAATARPPSRATTPSPEVVNGASRRIEVADRAACSSEAAPIFPKKEQSPAAATITQRGPIRPPAVATRAPAGVVRGPGGAEPVKSPSQRSPEEQNGQEGLSDDDWAAVMQSAFSKLNQ